jgi:soluble lytic murein transglycosylase-like protein
MKTNLYQAMLNLHTLRTMTRSDDVSSNTSSLFESILQKEQIKYQSNISMDTLNPTVKTKTTAGPTAYDSNIKSSAEKYNVDPKLIESIIFHESRYNPDAVSKSGAIGLMQLMPSTAKSLGIDPSDPSENIEGGTKYISQLLNQYNGNIELALSAYNAGPGNVRKYNGMPPFAETQKYVASVLETYYKS